jgi:hypothetical protein
MKGDECCGAASPATVPAAGTGRKIQKIVPDHELNHDPERMLHLEML